MSYKIFSSVLYSLLILSSCASSGGVKVRWLIPDPSTCSLLAPNPNDDVPRERIKEYSCISDNDLKKVKEAIR